MKTYGPVEAYRGPLLEAHVVLPSVQELAHRHTMGQPFVTLAEFRAHHRRRAERMVSTGEEPPAAAHTPTAPQGACTRSTSELETADLDIGLTGEGVVSCCTKEAEAKTASFRVSHQQRQPRARIRRRQQHTRQRRRKKHFQSQPRRWKQRTLALDTQRSGGGAIWRYRARTRRQRRASFRVNNRRSQTRARTRRRKQHTRRRQQRRRYAAAIKPPSRELRC